ncbi:MAG: 4-alpha-glucanotransferase [Nitrospirae bacterium]|nr:4-alpha-glucanotransferase [Nitrospirota bacterium]
MTAPRFVSRKMAGVMVPLFSLRTSRDLGIGDVLDLVPLMDWMASCGLEVLQLLPMNELTPGETSPYQALSGLAADPIYLALDDWPDVVHSDEARRLLDSAAVQRDLASWRDSPDIAYQPIRIFKDRLLRMGYASFLHREWSADTPRAKAFRNFRREHAEWLEPYARFRLLKGRHDGRDWAEWPAPFRDRDPEALRRLDAEHADELLYLHYRQWAMWEQWQGVRRAARQRGIRIMGDLPFLVSRDSADVWSRPEEFDLLRSVGAPADPFNPEQGWGLPLFRWSIMEPTKFPWWRLRLRMARAWFDLLRLDHVVGFFRVWVMSNHEPSHFEPEEEAEQIARGETFLKMFLDGLADCLPIAEDLGTIPPFVPHTLARLGIAGHKVLRWERHDGVYHDPAVYPYVSLATTGTHDTSTLSVWWKTLPDDERQAFLQLFDPEDVRRSGAEQAGVFTDEWHRLVLDRLLGSGSGLVILPIQDIFGHDEQINIPATVGPHNWTYRLPCPIEDFNRPPLEDKARVLRELLIRHGRTPG